MSFLTDAELASLRLTHMSLHIVSDGDFKPEHELAIEHEDFLLDRIRDVDVDSVYRFADQSVIRDKVEEIASRKVGFELGAQQLSHLFNKQHTGVARDGAFFVLEIGVENEEVYLYALMKYDYGQALEVVEKDGATGLRRIVEAFVGDKKAIQKSALIRVVGGKAEAVISTRDRTGKPAPQLTEYFQKFLDVVRDRTDKELTLVVKEVVRTSIADNREYLPEGGVAPAVSRALEVLRQTPVINEEAINHAVWVGAGQPEDEKVQAALQKSVGRHVKNKRLSGVSFSPDGSQLGKPITREVTTEEGVTIRYHSNLEGAAVKRRTLDDGATQFVVTTKTYTDAVLSDKTVARAR